MQEAVKENKLGTMKISKLLFSVSVPIIISMLVQAMYNVVDSIYIANFSKDALAALTYAFPMQNLMIGSATGLAVGLNAILSKSPTFQALTKRRLESGVFLICSINSPI